MRGRDRTCEVFIAHCDDAAVGLIQRYRFGAYPGYISELAPITHVRWESTSIDYLVGPAPLGIGIGTAIIAAFVARTWLQEKEKRPSIA